LRSETATVAARFTPRSHIGNRRRNEASATFLFVFSV
jgi:hypothetical protein